MVVRNYYQLGEIELDEAIKKIRRWLWDHPRNEKAAKAMFALDVALCAKEVDRSDPFIGVVIDKLIAGE